MPTILYVKPDDKRKRVIVGVEGEDNGVSTLDVSLSTYTSIGSPARGECISERNLLDITNLCRHGDGCQQGQTSVTSFSPYAED